jgi:hypothetical protein
LKTSFSRCEAELRALAIVIAVWQCLTLAAPSYSAAAKDELLSLDQKIKIAQLITKQTAPLADNSFSIAVDRIVPAQIQLQPLPSEAEQLAPQVHGLGYVVVNEEIALVDQRTRKVVLVFQRWGGQ